MKGFYSLVQLLSVIGVIASLIFLYIYSAYWNNSTNC